MGVPEDVVEEAEHRAIVPPRCSLLATRYSLLATLFSILLSKQRIQRLLEYSWKSSNSELSTIRIQKYGIGRNLRTSWRKRSTARLSHPVTRCSLLGTRSSKSQLATRFSLLLSKHGTLGLLEYSRSSAESCAYVHVDVHVEGIGRRV